MASSYELIQERSRYYAFIEQLKITKNKLKDAIDIVSELKSKVEEAYKVNEESGDSQVLKNELNSITFVYNNLNENLIPNVNNRINVLTHNIQVAEYNERLKAEREAEEKRREEERRREEENRSNY